MSFLKKKTKTTLMVKEECSAIWKFETLSIIAYKLIFFLKLPTNHFVLAFFINL